MFLLELVSFNTSLIRAYAPKSCKIALDAEVLHLVGLSNYTFLAAFIKRVFLFQ